MSWVGNHIWCDLDGYWWFWDETWANKYGPYMSRNEAFKAEEKYIEELG